MDSAEQLQSEHLLFLQTDPVGCHVLSVPSRQNVTLKDQRKNSGENKNFIIEHIFSNVIKAKAILYLVFCIPQ